MKTIQVNDHILLYALRYSLTRKTNAPINVMNTIISNIEYIKTESLERIIEEIESSNDIGFVYYEDTWCGLVSDLKFELRIRDMKFK